MTVGSQKSHYPQTPCKGQAAVLTNDGCVSGGSSPVVDAGSGSLPDTDAAHRLLHALGGARCLNGHGLLLAFDLESTVMTLGPSRSLLRSVVFAHHHTCLPCEGEETACGRGRGGRCRHVQGRVRPCWSPQIFPMTPRALCSSFHLAFSSSCPYQGDLVKRRSQNLAGA